MSAYEFTIDISTAKYEIKIDPTALYGYFEHTTMGEDRAGGLWFERQEDGSLGLIDYDGMLYLPRTVRDALRNACIAVDEIFD